MVLIRDPEVSFDLLHLRRVSLLLLERGFGRVFWPVSRAVSLGWTAGSMKLLLRAGFVVAALQGMVVRVCVFYVVAYRY